MLISIKLFFRILEKLFKEQNVKYRKHHSKFVGYILSGFKNFNELNINGYSA